MSENPAPAQKIIKDHLERFIHNEDNPVKALFY
jgi:hypothetical protein